MANIRTAVTITTSKEAPEIHRSPGKWFRKPLYHEILWALSQIAQLS